MKKSLFIALFAIFAWVAILLAGRELTKAYKAGGIELPVNATSIAIPNKIGISINWARAVLETRDVSRPLQLIESAGELLRCLIFSGCSESQGLYGSYLDSHMPWETHATGSLLTSEIISKTLATAKKTTKLLVCGVKVTLQPPESTPTERAEVNRAMVEAISKHV
jgi:hypothetical protein